MTIQELLNNGQLSQAIQLQTTLFTSMPGDVDAGFLFFELLVIAGHYEQSLEVLQKIASNDKNWKIVRKAYETLLKADEKRLCGKRPKVPGEIPDFISNLWKANAALWKDEQEKALRYIDKANSQAPEVRGHIDGEMFEGLRDFDDRTAFVVEFLTEGNYVWVPFDMLRSLKLEEEKGPLDAIFRPAEISLVSGDEIYGYIPLIYSGTHRDGQEETFLLGQETDYENQGDLLTCIGQRVWIINEQVVPVGNIKMLEVRPKRSLSLM